jgi:hypothetical protein
VSSAVSAKAEEITAGIPLDQIFHASHIKIQAASVAAASKGGMATVATAAAAATAAPALSGIGANIAIVAVSAAIVGGGVAVVDIAQEVNAPPAIIEEVPLPAYMPDASILFEGGEGTAEHFNPQSATLLQISNTGTVIGWRIVDQGGAESMSGGGATVSGVFDSLAEGQYEIVWLLENEDGVKAEVARKFEIAQ